eukprot:COSAG01_NODE_29619_length_633_cov_1.823970_1_plen_166_part_10
MVDVLNAKVRRMESEVAELQQAVVTLAMVESEHTERSAGTTADAHEQIVQDVQLATDGSLTQVSARHHGQQQCAATGHTSNWPARPRASRHVMLCLSPDPSLGSPRLGVREFLSLSPPACCRCGGRARSPLPLLWCTAAGLCLDRSCAKSWLPLATCRPCTAAHQR